MVVLAPLIDLPGTSPRLTPVDLKGVTVPVDRMHTAAADGAARRTAGDGRHRRETAEPGRPVVVTTAGGDL